MLRILLLTSLSLVAFAGCDTTDPVDTGPDTRGPETTECEGSAPYCAQDCGSDALVGPAVCTSGAWVCKQGVDPDDCPTNTCWGAPLPGELCSDGWACEPRAGILGCPQLLCATCRAPDGTPFEDITVANGTCACSCNGADQVTCAPVDAPCAASKSSNFPGVTLEITATDCTFSRAEAAAGIEIAWTLTVSDEAAGASISPRPQNQGSCLNDAFGGFDVFEDLMGADADRYCLCDTGLCGQDTPPLRAIAAGVHQGSFKWDGRNWDGPSDTGNPKGGPFEVGPATLTVSAIGIIAEAGLDSEYAVKATATVTITP